MKNQRPFTLSITSRSLVYQLRIAFYLMTALPLLVFIYILVRNHLRFGLQGTVLIVIAACISVIGFSILQDIISHVISVAKKAELLATGDVGRRIDIVRQDEIGDLGEALNKLAQRVRDSIDELKTYGQKTKELDFEMQKRIFALSGLLEISALVSRCAQLDDILKFVIEKIRLLTDAEVTYLFLKEDNVDGFAVKMADGKGAKRLLEITVDSEDALFAALIRNQETLVLDKQGKVSQEAQAVFTSRFGFKNTLVVPLWVKGATIGMLGIANGKEDFMFKNDDIELLDIFSKQIAIAIDNNALLCRVRRLEIYDALTGLYNEAFIRARLEEEITRAVRYQRPCSFVLLDIDNFRKLQDTYGRPAAEAILKKITPLLLDSVTEVDRVARVSDDLFAVVFPERNKRQAQRMADDIRKKIEFVFGEEQDASRRLTVSGGVSENPLDGITADELIAKARETLNLAKQQGKNRING